MIYNVKKYRLRAELSQAELAAKVGVTRETVSRIETGRSCPSIELAYRFATVLNATIEELFVPEEERFLQ